MNKKLGVAVTISTLLVLVASLGHAAENVMSSNGWSLDFSYGYDLQHQDRSEAVLLEEQQEAPTPSLQLSEHVFDISVARRVAQIEGVELGVSLGGGFHPEDNECIKFPSAPAEAEMLQEMFLGDGVCSSTSAQRLFGGVDVIVPVASSINLNAGVGLGKYWVQNTIKVFGAQVDLKDDGFTSNFHIGGSVELAEEFEVGVQLQHLRYNGTIKIEPQTALGMNARWTF